MKKSTITEIIAALFILLFVYAATAKLSDFENFKLQLAQSPMIGPLAKFVSLIIPITELFIAVLLFTQRFRLLGLYASFTMMILFTSYIIGITQFSEFIPCSCGGILSNMGWNHHLIFNSSFALLAMLAITICQGQPGEKIFWNKNAGI